LICAQHHAILPVNFQKHYFHMETKGHFMPGNRPSTASAQRHSEWQVRPLVGGALHFTGGGTVQLFDFRKRGTTTAYQFVFVGGGAGIGPQLGGASTGFPTPHEFIARAGRFLGENIYETVRQMAGRRRRHVENLDFSDSIMSFVEIETETPFSALDLHQATGRVSMASASLAVGYAVCIITAQRSSRVYFNSQSTAGTGAFNQGTVGGTAGVSFGASINLGLWLRV
jgi:hypothetical protein